MYNLDAAKRKISQIVTKHQNGIPLTQDDKKFLSKFKLINPRIVNLLNDNAPSPRPVLCTNKTSPRGSS